MTTDLATMTSRAVPTHDYPALADRVEIEALRGEFNDAVMMRDYDRVASLFTRDGVWRMPDVPAELAGRDEIRGWGERVPVLVDYLVQTTHPGTIVLDGDTASGRAYVHELGRARDGRSVMNYAIYHDRYQRTDDGWKFSERFYEIRYLDTTALAGSPHNAGGAVRMTDPTTPTGLPLAAGRWAIDFTHASVGFTVRHLGVSKVRGRFNVFEADVVVGDDLAGSSLTASVALDSIDTGNGDRDASVLSPDILDVARRPTLTFRSATISALGGERYAIAGDVTIADVTRPLTLRAEFGGIETSIDGTRHAGFEAVGELRRKDFGIGTSIPGGFLGEVVTIELDVQLIEPQSPDGSDR
jgi:polyisoprenoid-binding protein YceI/ketosteroid isomerase-like protein